MNPEVAPPPTGSHLCPYCQKELRPHVVRVVPRYWNRSYDDDEYLPFCKLDCALGFARAAHKAGYRIKVGL